MSPTSCQVTWSIGIAQRKAEAQTGAKLHLTEREVSILRLVAGGYSNKEIGRSLHLSEGTVKVHMAGLFRNLKVVTRVAAAVAGGRFLQSRPTGPV